MINKKRLAMMAVAASMVLPTNLMISPIFAQDMAEEEFMIETQNTGTSTTSSTEVKELTQTFIDNLLEKATKETPGSLPEGSYRLTGDITINGIFKRIGIDKKVVIDLNGHSIYSNAKDVFTILANGSLEILGKEGAINKIVSTASSTTAWDGGNTGQVIAIRGTNGQLTVGPEVFIAHETSEQNPCFIYGISIFAGGTNSKVNVTGATIKADGGITALGNLANNNIPVINLTNVAIVANTLNTENPGFTSVGIYQAGPSIFNVVNSNIYSDCVGIETRAGTLNLSGSSINGGTGGYLSIQPNGNGTTTSNAGLAIAPHKDGHPLNARIVNTIITGKDIALMIANPQEKKLTNSSIVVSNSTLISGSENKYPAVGYATSAIPFTLINTKLIPDKIQEFEKEASAEEEKKFTYIPKNDSDDDDQKVPYTVVPSTSTSTATTTADVTITLEESSIQDVKGNKQLTPAGQQQVANEIENNLNTDQPGKLNYTYTATVDPNFAILDSTSNSYTFLVTLSAELKDDSIIRLLIPLAQADPTSKTQAGEVKSEAAQTEDGNYEADFYALDVKKSNVLKDGKFNKDMILTELEKIPEIVGRYKDSDIKKFESITFASSYPVVDAYTPVTFKISDVSGGTTPGSGSGSGTTTGGGGSHKPAQPKPEEPTPPVVGTPTSMYRLYNRLTGEHLYTVDKNERDNLLTSDTWKDEGEGWIAPSESAYPVYRLLNPNNGDHHYTMDKNEFDTLPTLGWVAEGVAFFSADKDNTENVLLHRVYNPNATGAGSHHYTADTNERDALVAQGWKYEGLAWAGLPANK